MTFQLGDLVSDPRVPMNVSLLNRPATRAEREGWAYSVRTIERFDVTAAYAWHQNGLDRKGQSLSSFPPLRMPFPDLWVEAASHLIPDTARTGAIVKDLSNEDESMRRLRREILSTNPDAVFGDRMLLVGVMWWSSRTGISMSPLFHIVHMTTAGEFVDYDVSTGDVHRQVNKDQLRFEAEAQQMLMVVPLLFGMSLSNVKGSRTSEPRFLGNPHSKKGKRKPPRNRYRVISIPGSPTDERVSKGGHRDMAKHLVRGHFKKFGPDNKLFGKYETTVWVPHHVRGKKEQGVVEKDYAVEPPIE